MAFNSKIEWTNHTDNLWIGCTGVHAGCDNCYAEAVANRWGKQVWGNENPRQATKGVWGNFMRQQAIAAAAGEKHRVFVGSLMDIFEKSMPCKYESKVIPRINGDIFEVAPNGFIQGGTGYLRNFFFEEIVPNCPNLVFLLLTKRPSNINKMIPMRWVIDPPENVIFGTSPVDEPTFRTLVPQLLRVNGKRFLSIEPQLAAIYPTYEELEGIDWVIQGGESGPNRRPFDIQWAYDMREICARNGIPYFFKQIDKILQIPEDLQIRQFPKMFNIAA